MDGPADVDDGGTGWHLGVGELVGVGPGALHLLGGGQYPVVEAVTSGDDPGGPVLAGEVDERDDRRELEFGMWLRDVAPDRFVTVQPLLLGSGAALEEMTEVELVAGA